MGVANSNVVQAAILVLSAITQASYVQGGHQYDENDMTWNAFVADHFDVWRQINTGGFAYLATVNPATNGDAYDDIGLASTWILGTYDYYVLAKDVNGNTLATSNTSSTTWT